jgi:hypothetical protein
VVTESLRQAGASRFANPNLANAFPIGPKSAETNKPWGRKVISRNVVEVLIPA